MYLYLFTAGGVLIMLNNFVENRLIRKGGPLIKIIWRATAPLRLLWWACGRLADLLNVEEPDSLYLSDTDEDSLQAMPPEPGLSTEILPRTEYIFLS